MAAAQQSVVTRRRVSANLLSTAGGGYVAVEFLFIQFAGFTFGKSSSAYATPWNGFPGNINSSLLGGHNTDTGVNNIQYTAEFGNGVSATIGLDDPTVWDRTAVYNLSIPGAIGANGTGSNAYAGTHAPEIVGRIRVDQAWGLFQVSAAAHEVSGSYNTLGAGAVPTNPSEISGHPDTKWGGSVMAALHIKNLPTGTGDDIKIDASYAKGATKYVIATSGTSPSFAMFGDSSFGYQSVGFGATTDGVYFPGAAGTGGIELTTAWGVRGAFNHNWDPYWSSSLFGSYSAVRYDGGANDNLLGAGTTSAKGPTAPPSPPATRVRHWSATTRATTPATPTSTSPSSGGHPLDPGQEPDVLGRSPVVPSRPEDVGQFGVHGDRSEADRAVRIQGSGYVPAAGSRTA